jgi:hydroxypyruvate isomerase
MKLCANLSLMFTEVPLVERFAKAKACGFQAVEIQFPYEAELGDLVNAKNDTELEVVLINVPAGDLMTGGEGLASVPELTEEYSQALEQCLEYATALKVRAVNVLAGRCLTPEKETQYWQTFEWNLARTADTLSEHNILTTFEAINTKDMPGFLVHRAEHLWSVMARVNHPNVKAQYDLYHMAMMGENLWHDLSTRTDQIGHIQFADMPGRGEPGTGGLAFKPLFQIIEDSTYQGYVAAEYKPTQQTEKTLNWMGPRVMPS